MNTFSLTRTYIANIIYPSLWSAAFSAPETAVSTQKVGEGQVTREHQSIARQVPLLMNMHSKGAGFAQ